MSERLDSAITEVLAALEHAMHVETMITKNARWYIEALDAGDDAEAAKWLRSMRAWLGSQGEDDE